MNDLSYTVMDRLPGYTLNELMYRRPELLEEHKIVISYQLGLHTAFSYVFGLRDGYQSNYVFDPVTRILTRIDKERFLELPPNPDKTLQPQDPYTQEIASCELSNLKYMHSFREGVDRNQVVDALKEGFMDKYDDIKNKKQDLLQLVTHTRDTWLKLGPSTDVQEYEKETQKLASTVSFLVDQDPKRVWRRLVEAKREVDSRPETP
ncbi:MAG: hypothetical protein GF334_12915 [Candidatus Altiarchaeales archaeon]|nr:hypothetical protein [Candidatus Altiarchaeales archaeon]